MTGSVLICAVLAVGAAPVPPVPANAAPSPRLVKPDLSLITVEVVRDAGLVRVHRSGFRNGKPMPVELVWEGDRRDLDQSLGTFRIFKNRYLVAPSAIVIDLSDNKVLNKEKGWIERIGDTKVTYYAGDDDNELDLVTFEYATGKRTRIGKSPARRGFDSPCTTLTRSRLSPDHNKHIMWKDRDELILYRDKYLYKETEKSLGKGFTIQTTPDVETKAVDCGWFPVLWLDDERIMTQRANGKLVIVDLAGKVTEAATIKDVPKVKGCWLFRDPSGGIVYNAGEQYYRIDLEKKSGEKSEWMALGNDFEGSYDTDKERPTIRYQGKEIGQFKCFPDSSVTAPGYIALMSAQHAVWSGDSVSVWSTATRDWISLDYRTSKFWIVGWIK